MLRTREQDPRFPKKKRLCAFVYVRHLGGGHTGETCKHRAAKSARRGSAPETRLQSTPPCLMGGEYSMRLWSRGLAFRLCAPGWMSGGMKREEVFNTI